VSGGQGFLSKADLMRIDEQDIRKSSLFRVGADPVPAPAEKNAPAG
jgi:hypothetical protein